LEDKLTPLVQALDVHALALHPTMPAATSGPPSGLTQTHALAADG
jgi:hypothetical protein